VTCHAVRKNLPGYLDGAAPLREHSRIRAHLIACTDCSDLLQRYQRLSMLLAHTEPVAPPPDLAFRIRMEASRLRARPSWTRQIAGRCWLLCRNIVQPLAVPATGGILAALLTFAVLTQSLVVGVQFGSVPGDLPLHLIQPARLENLAPFPVSDLEEGSESAGAHVIVVEAAVGSRGGVLGYQILSGPDTPAVRRQLDQVLMFSSFSPQLSFGRPTSAGRVVLSFSEVRVKG